MKKGFTFIEMIFVIVIMGILAKFGAEIFRNVYLNYNQSLVNNKLQTDTTVAIQQITNRLQYRIKDSVIARDSSGFKALSDMNSTDTYNILEWVGYDIDGWLGDGGSTNPTWSGFIDVDDASAIASANTAGTAYLKSTGTDTTRIQAVINNLSGTTGTNGINNSAIFFTGANSDINTDYGWDTTATPTDQNDTAAHRIKSVAAQIERLATNMSGINKFRGTDIYEQYKLSWTAYALELNTTSGDLTLHYNYQPWSGDAYTDGNSSLIMKHVSTFKFQGAGDIIKLQLCVSDNNMTGDQYSLCKEKAIF